MFTYKYPRPALTVDCAIFCKIKSIYHILLIQRANPPFQKLWAFPGGFVDIDEDIDAAAYRELKEETGFEGLALCQFKTYGKPDRDPRGRTVSVVYYAILESENLPIVKGEDDALKADWIPLNHLPELAFDHQKILSDLLDYLQF
ncbi:NUDIX domain-containing protein [Ancylomarina longa]|uniref:NUDIX hydrolase n=1 Tax=Ancylomarina longa TaxID=2487017 RepID=A0A434AU34_9BACT|nr:NUDIX hydrolase [Ancylomarina longa]RUT77853.1 NUDIX hydrolase [Ancylomarina longa]